MASPESFNGIPDKGWDELRTSLDEILDLEIATVSEPLDDDPPAGELDLSGLPSDLYFEPPVGFPDHHHLGGEA